MNYGKYMKLVLLILSNLEYIKSQFSYRFMNVKNIDCSCVGYCSRRYFRTANNPC